MLLSDLIRKILVGLALLCIGWDIVGMATTRMVSLAQDRSRKDAEDAAIQAVMSPKLLATTVVQKKKLTKKKRFKHVRSEK